MTEKLTGYTLLIFGLIVIVGCGLNIYGILIGTLQPIQLFHFQGVSVDLSQLMKGGLPPEVARQLVGQPSMSTELVSSDVLSKPTNLLAHLALVGFLASIGQKIASLGVMFLRPIVVKTKSSESLS